MAAAPPGGKPPALEARAGQPESAVGENTEGALRRERELNADVIGSSVDGILAFDRQCRYTVWNPAMERMSGLSASKVLGRCAFDVFPFLQEIGEDFYFYEALAGREAVASDRRFTIPSTGREGFFEGRYSPLRNADGEVVGGLGIIHDITELKETHAQLLQAGRLAAMGQLGAGLAHELNQPLTGIRLLLHMLGEHGERRVSEVMAELDVIAEQIDRMGRIVDNVRGFARKSGFDPRATPATDPLRRTLALMREQLRLAGVDVFEALPDALPPIRADNVQMQQVFLNLLTNALHALQRHDGPRRLDLAARVLGDRVEFSVEDSGPGIGDDVGEKVFEPFFTTKEPGEGTGLGLALCYGILEAHGGSIRYESPADGGARFVLTVPIADATADRVEEARARPTPAAGRILVVDDEQLLRNVIGQCLRHAGFVYEAVADAPTALATAAATTFDLALVDLKMPRMDGLELTRQLRAEHPELRVVVMSGFVSERERADLDALGVLAVLSKPFDAQELLATVSEAVTAPVDG